MKLIRKHQSGNKFIKPDISIKSDYFNKSNISSKNIPSIEELIKKQSDKFNTAALLQKGTLTDLGGSPDPDNRTQAERNKDYLNSKFNAEKFERGATNFVKGIKPYAGAAATAFGATAVIPASYGAWGFAGGTALKGGVTGMGLGQLGVGSGDVKSDFIAGAMGESLPIIGRNIVNIKNPIKWTPNPNNYYRVVGKDAIEDLQATNLVRSKVQSKGLEKTGGINLGSRPTAFPSFSKGSPSMEYARNLKDHYILETNRPMATSTLGRHGSGTTQFPVDESGKYLTEFPADQVRILKPH